MKTNHLKMKIWLPLLALALLLGVLSGCKKNESDPPKNETDRPKNEKNSVLLLKVDYTTYAFEGGVEIELPGTPDTSGILPIRADYVSPGDFGSIALYYRPSDQLIFDGEIFWMGEGKLYYPEAFKPASEFEKTGTAFPFPAGNIKNVNALFEGTDDQSDYLTKYPLVWDAVKNLKILEDYPVNQNKIGIFLYTPCVGIGDPEHWDWFILLFK